MIFLINGKANSGKDTVADYFVKKFDADKLWFAKAIKDYAMRYFGFNYAEVYHEKIVFSRRALLAIGDMFRDKVDKFYWINLVISKIVKSAVEGQRNFVLSDCRLIHEIVEVYRAFDDVKNILSNAEFIDYKMLLFDHASVASTVSGPKIPCYTITIVRENCPDIECGSGHSTENELNDFKFDFIINNNGTIRDLYKKIDKIIDAL